MRFEPAISLRGDLAVPGDKSVSHRALLLGTIADGDSEARGFGRSADTLSTAAAVRALGATVDEDGDTMRVRGVGLRGLRSPGEPIDCGNAGTLVRLLSGLLVGQAGSFELVGDESLSSRPQERIAGPLREMGARIETTDGHAPLRIEGGPLHPIAYDLPVASAQVKSCILLAGLYAEGGPTTVREPAPTRDHTERMLAAAGAHVERRAGAVSIRPADRLRPLSLDVPGDFSSAAPFLAVATLLPGSELRLHGIGVNPTRTGFLHVLERMGARISVYHRREAGGEPVADLEVAASELVATEVRPEEVPLLIDELPLFALVAAHAHGESSVRGAQELRVKETDRIETVTSALRSIGVHIQSRPDGFTVRGVPTRPAGGVVVESGGDHRIAMLGALAGLVSREAVEVDDAECVRVSFPEFFDVLDSLVLR
ncbi:MAG: 3-phosphoshikimate 1-carboxyvinyltransferase [Gaiellales bacterium]